MAVPELRTTTAQRSLNKEIADCEYDLPLWRYRRENGGSRNAKKLDFSVLDRNKQAGWDLVCTLIRSRNQYFRGRLSVEEALNHRFFRGD